MSRQLKYTLVQFQIRIERWLGQEMLRVGLLGDRGSSEFLPALNRTSKIMGGAFQINYPFVPIDLTRAVPAYWQPDWRGGFRYGPLGDAVDPRMTLDQYDNRWSAPDFTNRAIINGSIYRSHSPGNPFDGDTNRSDEE